MTKKTISEKVQECIVVDGTTGEVIKSTTTKESHMLSRNPEPDYIKLYTKMWCEFNDIPEYVRPTFLQLVMRMSYCNSQDLKNSQIVYTIGPNKDAIMNALKLTNDRVFYRHLEELVKCNAIHPVYKNGKKTRGCYQINPQYAGRGAWRYNAKENQGGIEDLIATFRFKDRTVDTQIVYAAHDESDNAQDLGLFHDGQQVVAKKSTYTPAEDLPWASNS